MEESSVTKPGTTVTPNTAEDAEGSGRQAGPVVVLVIGMAGSGKTTLMGRLQTSLGERGSNGYLINLDPAVMTLPYEPHVDIRDTVRCILFPIFLVQTTGHYLISPPHPSRTVGFFF